MDVKTVIERAIEHCGTQGELSRRSALSQQYISKLLTKGSVPSVEVAIAISRATSGAVKIRDLVPGVVDAVLDEARLDQKSFAQICPERAGDSASLASSP